MDILRRTSPRAFGFASLGLLAACAAVPGGFPLGGATTGSAAGRGLALALGLLLGWGIPGLSLAFLAPGGRGDAARLLGRALGLGFGWIFACGLAHAAVFGGAPGRTGWLFLLALPAAWAVARPGRDESAAALFPAAALIFLAAAVLTGWLWPEFHDAAFSGDGMEVHELARSLDARVLPRWDLESPVPGGRFGIPVVVPFWSGAYLSHAEAAVLGRGELAARLPFASSLALAAVLSLGFVRRRGRAATAYAAAAAALFALRIGAPSDLASPGALDALTAAVWLAGFRELVEGAPRAGAAFLVLAGGVTYAAPVLGALALVSLFCFDRRRGRAAAGPCVAAAALALTAAAVVGKCTGTWPEWLRQIGAEYVDDYVRSAGRDPLSPTIANFLLATGCLPLAIPFAWKKLDAVERTLAVTGSAYLGIILCGSVKSFHYLSPLPWIFLAPAMAATADRARLASAGLVAAAVAFLSPGGRAVDRGAIELGRVTCVPDKDYERAVLAASPDLPSGRHVFIRYGLELGSCPGEPQ